MTDMANIVLVSQNTGNNNCLLTLKMNSKLRSRFMPAIGTKTIRTEQQINKYFPGVISTSFCFESISIKLK